MQKHDSFRCGIPGASVWQELLNATDVLITAGSSNKLGTYYVVMYLTLGRGPSHSEGKSAFKLRRACRVP